MPQTLSASTMIGNKVVNDAGEDLGKIEELVVDSQEGQVTYAVLSFGGFMGMGDKLFAVPWKQLRLDTGDELFRLNLAKEALEEAPGFDKDHWPNFGDPQWSQEVDSYYSQY